MSFRRAGKEEEGENKERVVAKVHHIWDLVREIQARKTSLLNLMLL